MSEDGIISNIAKLKKVRFHSAVGLCKETEAPGERVVVPARSRCKTLVEIAYAAADAHRLIDLAANCFTM